MPERRNGHASPIKPFPKVDRDPVVRVLTVKEALQFVGVSRMLAQASQAWGQMAQDFGIDPSGAYRLNEDTAELVQVTQPVSSASEA